MILQKLREFLDVQNIRYVIISHSMAFTAQEIAQSAHIPGREIAKTVIVKIDGRMIMAVLPASEMVDFNLLKAITGTADVTLANEDEFTALFPECERGAMPPFGNLYGLEVIAADSLADDADIAFNAGTHRELVRMAFKDFMEVTHPRVAKFTVRRKSSGEG